jgi:phosphoribosylaminoimidazolecarboxamide formyltransferase/IMP cyclohydrolase
MTTQRTYHPQFELKYGCNPHQQPSALFAAEQPQLPFVVRNGKPGYINLLDALNAWQLVAELDQSLNLPAAASFKHVSPAGAAVATPLSEALLDVYECRGKALSELALAYVRARGADPMSSFGDFIALSRNVDVATAQFIKTQVSDGVIAPGYEAAALEILSAKKGGAYVVLQAIPEYAPPEMEYREVFGVGFSQKRNHVLLTRDNLLGSIVTQRTALPEEAQRDLVLASIVLKYTQSNSVGYALDGQMIGIGAGQQSRIDCTKLAGRKADLWYLRQHPRVRELAFADGTKAVDRTNARVNFLEGDMTPPEHAQWAQLFREVPPELTTTEKQEWLQTLQGVSISSDAFFPFRDNIDQASKRGVRYVVQPGGSTRDDVVIAAADEYAMTMAFSGIRLFHH